jgi:hypothetical protein
MRGIKAMTVSDVFTRNGYVCADAKMIFDRYLARVKRTSRSDPVLGCPSMSMNPSAATCVPDPIQASPPDRIR